MTVLRVMTYNILLGGKKGRGIDAVVAAARPDVLLVNETPKRPLLWRRQCGRLARRWGMTYVVGGRPAGSNMIVIGPGIVVKASGATRLPQPRRQPRRGLAWAQLRVQGQLVGVLSVHLSLDRQRRVDEVRAALDAVARLRGPVVLAGDLNEPPDGASWSRLRAAGFRDAGTSDWCTFPADTPAGPDRRIDAVLVRGDARVTHHGDPGCDPDLMNAASDHRPVLAVLDLG